MKKLFFTALVAVVAIGGAFASNSNFAKTYWTVGQSGSADVDCSGTSGDLCTAVFTELYDAPAGDPGRNNIIGSLTNSQYYIP